MIEELIKLKSSLQLTPKSPDKCPVFCCFYAEFDIKTGPVVRYQSPENFMDQDINTTTAEIHDILEKTFESYKSKKQKSQRDDNEYKGEKKRDNKNIQRNSPPSTGRSGDSDKTEKQKLSDGGQSFFDSTSEYIITGSELTGKIITLSTHEVHVMTRPTQIANEKYERNALLFSIGMVLRRAADPRPFRPLISKLATTLRSMEIETGLLSDQIKVNRILQPLLEQILISMNSPRWECNLLLDRSTALNLKLFHPPKPPASPVHEYQVPVLLVRDYQLGYYEWDLAINWVILHIDGITNARQISVKAEVDLELVLACLRVLRHHCVIEVIDMFVYTNRYECTERAAAMLAGKEDKLLQEVVEFAMKRHQASGSPYYYSNSSVRSHGTNPSSSFPPRSLNLFGAGGSSQRSTHFRHAMMVASSLEREQTFLLEGGHRHNSHRKHLKAALAELYCACNRNLSFGDLWFNSNNGKTTVSSSSVSSPTNWNEIFKGFDHRRFVTFGVVNGLLTRVHSYPFFHGPFPEKRKRFSIYDPGLSQVIPPESARNFMKKEATEEKNFEFAKSVSEVMDGTMFDDELVCMFERPFNVLVELVEKYSGKKVAQIFARAGSQ
eukprot:jgi/Psemu1/256036/estExt_Genewise1Plus.C_1660052